MEFCKTNDGMNLVSFQLDNPSENQEISGIVQAYQEQLSWNFIKKILIPQFRFFGINKFV